MAKLPHVSTLPFNEQHVKSYAHLKKLVGNKMASLIVKQHEMGDPDWLFDIVSELDHYPKVMLFRGSEEWFIPLTQAGYTSAHFDCHAISNDIDNLLK